MRFLIIRRLIANKWLWAITFLAGSVCIGIIFAMRLNNGHDAVSPTEYINSILAGAFLGFAITWVILAFVNRIIAWINGAPFAKGDMVQVLAGKNRGQIGKVYDVWSERLQVCVKFDLQANNNCNSTFSYLEVCRVRKKHETNMKDQIEQTESHDENVPSK